MKIYLSVYMYLCMKTWLLFINIPFILFLRSSASQFNQIGEYSNPTSTGNSSTGYQDTPGIIDKDITPCLLFNI